MEVQHCKDQHEVLRSFIRYTLQFWGPRDKLPLSYWIDHTADRAYHPTPRHFTTPELDLVLARAKVLSEECRQPLPPLRAALLHTKRSQAFTDILKEIQWCVSVVNHKIICSEYVKTRSAPEPPWDANLGQHEELMLKEAEQEDWRDLMRKLEYWGRDHECCAEECGNEHGRSDPRFCLAAQMLKELSAQGSNSDDSDHLCKLWSFDESALKYGRPLGSGSFGGVTEATWMGDMYALKKFGVPEHFLQPEAEALSKLNHPHIVKVYACSEDSLLLDLMSTDLQKFIRTRMQGGTRDQPFSLRAAIDLMLQIAEAVSYLHSQGMVHRDLKSANILVDPVEVPGDDMDDDGYVFAKVADFGLAKVKNEVTRYSHLTLNTGTRAYMAPEIFGANKDDDHLEHAYPMKADVYSFGIICSEILTGQEPFKDVPRSSLYTELTKVLPLRPQLPEQSSEVLNLLIKWCWGVDPRSYEVLNLLIKWCWGVDPRERPTFIDVCEVLRYLKVRHNTVWGLIGPMRNLAEKTWVFQRWPALTRVQAQATTRTSRRKK